LYHEITTTKQEDLTMSAFDKVIGYGSIKKELQQLCDMMCDLARYQRLGARMPRGLLLHGDPGLGKSLMARCLIEESGRTAYTVRRDKPNGDFINKLHQTFSDAAKNAPAIILLEDMDKFVVEEKSDEEYVAIQAAIDETAEADVFVIATANDLYGIPDSLLRAGRFDRKIKVSAPIGKDSEDIICHYLASKPIGETVNRSDVAKMLYGHSCADLEMAMNEAAIYAGAEHSDKIEMPHLVEAILRNVYELRNDDWPLCEKERQEMAYHEAGHAAIQELLCEGGVGFATVISHCGGCEGITVTHSNEYQRAIHRILIDLGGLAAEEIKFGTKSWGGKDDIRKAAKDIESYLVDSGLIDLGLAQGGRHLRSEQLLFERETAISKELERYFVVARRMLAENREFLDAVAAKLCEKRILLNSDIRQIREGHTIVSVSNII